VGDRSAEVGAAEACVVKAAARPRIVVAIVSGDTIDVVIAFLPDVLPLDLFRNRIRLCYSLHGFVTPVLAVAQAFEMPAWPVGGPALFALLKLI
jgi:hypothetical protein